ncbi:MAG: hypothetical protein V4801_05405 [Burkholderia gladioli]
MAEAQQVGVVDSGVYYSVNPALPKGTRVQVLSDDGQGVVQCCGEIAGPAGQPGRQVLDSLHDRQVKAYTLAPGGAVTADSSGFGIAGNVKMVRQGAHPQAVLADGSHLNFSTCASAEGVHYLGRRAGDNKLLVHLYEYFDGDLESNCKDSELK